MDGILPSEICLLDLLENIIIPNNKLKGQLPSCLTRMQTLEEINIRNNEFSGPLPPGLFEMPSLEVFVISNNNFSGSLDVLLESSTSEDGTSTSRNVFFHAFQQLKVLSIDNNGFDDMVPSELFFLAGLDTLTLHGNNLSGNLDVLCTNQISLLTADCANVVCTCCTQCF